MMKFLRAVSRRNGVLILVAVIILLTFAAGIYMFAGKHAPDGFDPNNPVALTIWHNPTGQDKDALSAAVDRFNRSVGRERGVSIIATTIAKSELLHEKLASIALGIPGAPEPPDIAIAYPKSAVGLADKGLLIDFEEHFSKEELDKYVPSFIESGRLGDGKLYVFPVGKSAEGLIINRTFWDRFSAATGTPISELSTFEGIIRAAEKYYEWTDANTPDTEDDGSAFFMIDNPFNMAQATFAQMGEDLFAGGGLNEESPIYERVWKILFEPVIRGYEASYKGYGTDIAKTGKLLCWTSSTAGITFVPKSVTYDDNTSEPVEFEILPFPIMEGGKKVVIQRGGGFCLFKSTQARENAAVLFLKWLTSPEENLRYLESLGYMPVTNKAIEVANETWGEQHAAGIYKSYIDTMKTMNNEYTFLAQKQLENYAELEIFYDGRVRKLSASARDKYLKNLLLGEEEAMRSATQLAYEKFIE
ncbi:MAG: extracellular solute-binding protein [Synergistaceae bacterium]|nr:extracellular solute-binding protein [Synergistaceae bacterium]